MKIVDFKITGYSTTIKRSIPKNYLLQSNIENILPVKKIEKENFKEIDDKLDNDKSNLYKIAPQFIKKIFVGSNDIIDIDLFTSNEIPENAYGNVIIRIVDGSEQEISEIFDIESNYNSVKDMINGENKIISANIIKNICIKNQISNICKKKIENSTKKEAKYGREILSELHKTYPMILSPMMEFEDLEALFLSTLDKYI
ncbi:hypothetical protein [Fusobacterium sp. PH5-29]